MIGRLRADDRLGAAETRTCSGQGAMFGARVRLCAGAVELAVVIRSRQVVPTFLILGQPERPGPE